MKRFFDGGDDRIPAVEKLYKQNQGTYATAGGFDEDDDWCEERREQISEAVQKKRNLPFEHLVAPEECKDCGGSLFSDAILWNRFNYPVCDLCRDETERHKLIARTEAKERFLLKDCDLDLRKPPLRFVSRKNPHNARYGDMKLYLKPQLEARALELYGSFAKLEEEREKRERQRKATAEKRFEQKIQKIRKEVGKWQKIKWKRNLIGKLNESKNAIWDHWHF
ncbi:hypothetical protein niasHT_034636 [Heterodera trifolii]|uniref:XPA C-terminal domain-containing protein n=1 Tax=Heterodera trifolii TaxID=157864 RepID=A0ABD2IV47_9BILA